MKKVSLRVGEMFEREKFIIGGVVGMGVVGDNNDNTKLYWKLFDCLSRNLIIKALLCFVTTESSQLMTFSLESTA